jgi:hypothetical protein
VGRQFSPEIPESTSGNSKKTCHRSPSPSFLTSAIFV